MIDRAIFRFIAITDNVRDGQNGLIERAKAVARGGATCIQLRVKDVSARDLAALAAELIRSVEIPVIINDRADVALAVGAAGVHVGADDVPASVVRSIAPPGFIIGASVGTDDEVRNAEGADYVGIGPVYATGSKKDAGRAIGVEEFSRLAVATGLPAVAIGGITPANARAAIDAGAAGIASIASVFGATDPLAAARAMASAIGK
jgi:thiamine-phosphate pyrophosphorylase